MKFWHYKVIDRSASVLAFFFSWDSYSVNFSGIWSSCSILLLYSAANHLDVIDQIASACAGKYSFMLLDDR